MKLTTKAHYSIKALLDLALTGSQHPVSVRRIAERQNIPAPYLEKLLIELRQAGLVHAYRGAQGGYQLARSPQRICLADILAAVGETLEVLDPPDSTTGDPPTTALAEAWVTTSVWQRISQKVQQVLQEITLEDLYYDARSWQAEQSQASGFIV
ncbi:MAG: RrF2 family transcriptional regulator [Cyanobacteriota bacterium]|nr:RrF2 family transcriptional regulator [Cyanobacteriota bacterium]